MVAVYAEFLADMNVTTFIYSLHDPETGHLRYIGKSNSPKRRLAEHFKEARRGRVKGYKNNWLRQLASRGRRPLMLIVDKVMEPSWAEAEKHYIKRARELGFDLVNGTDGGDGAKLTEEAENRRKQAVAFFWASPESEEVRERLRLALLGNKRGLGKRQSPESNKKRSLALLGNKNSLGKSHSLATRKKIISSTRGEKNHFFGKKHSAESREKISFAKRGKKSSAEAREKISLALKRTWAKRKESITCLA